MMLLRGWIPMILFLAFQLTPFEPFLNKASLSKLSIFLGNKVACPLSSGQILLFDLIFLPYSGKFVRLANLIAIFPRPSIFLFLMWIWCSWAWCQCFATFCLGWVQTATCLHLPLITRGSQASPGGQEISPDPAFLHAGAATDQWQSLLQQQGLDPPAGFPPPDIAYCFSVNVQLPLLGSEPGMVGERFTLAPTWVVTGTENFSTKKGQSIRYWLDWILYVTCERGL